MGSILLAFGIEAWWDGRQERAREDALLHGLLADFEAARPLLVSRISIMERRVQNGVALRDAAASSAGDPALQVSADLIGSAIGSATFQPGMNTLEAALTSGDVGLIRSDSIRGELTRWSTSMTYISATQEVVRGITTDQIVPLLSRDVALGAYFDGTDQPATIRPSLELSGVIAQRHNHQRRAIGGLNRLLETLDRLVGLLEAELR